MGAGEPSPPWKQNKAAAAIDASSEPLAASAARLSGRSRYFHFYNNELPSFKSSVITAAVKADASPAALAASPHLPRQQLPSPRDDLLERLDDYMDQFKALREEEEATGRKAVSEESGDGFLFVYGWKNRPSGQGGRKGGFDGIGNSGSVRMVTKDKAIVGETKTKVPFHIPTIPLPQDVYRFCGDNNNMPFEHVWLERSGYGTRCIHPLEKLSVEQLIDRNIPQSEPVNHLLLRTPPLR